MNPGPHFIIIGAMKCATSTLHDRLAEQPGVFMTEPKEPCYFSDDEVYARGEAWYRSLFEDAGPGELRGESSTHYTKLPTHPHTVERCAALRPPESGLKLIYVMRDPIDRIVSQYVHEWSMRLTDAPIDRSVDELPILVDYSRYAMQLSPWFEVYGKERVLPVCFERFTAEPERELERVAAFLGLPHPLVHDTRSEAVNASAQRIRASPWRDRLVEYPALRALRRTLVPKSFRTWVRSRWAIRDRPRLSDAVRERLESELDPEMKRLGDWLGRELSCATWKQAVREGDAPDWCDRPAPRDAATEREAAP